MDSVLALCGFWVGPGWILCGLCVYSGRGSSSEGRRADLGHLAVVVTVAMCITLRAGKPREATDPPPQSVT